MSGSGGNYTLNSIAAVVIGGTSLFGGSGTAIGSIFGAFVLRTISDLLFVFDLPPLWLLNLVCCPGHAMPPAARGGPRQSRRSCGQSLRGLRRRG